LSDRPTLEQLLRRDLPDGQISRDLLLHPVHPLPQKYFAMPVGQIISTSSPRPAPQRGARAIVTDAGRDAMDADGTADESAKTRTAKSCGPDASTPASSLQGSASDGDKQARSPGRARSKPLKLLCREGRVIPVDLAVTTLVCFFIFAREAAGATGTRLSLRPLFSRRLGHATRAHSRRGNAEACLTSSLRTQGPITTGISGCAKVVEQRLSKQAARGMGPRVRGDDIICRNSASYCFLRSGVTVAVASPSPRQRKISAASTG
jgi:hypothetical protein